jgi:hypothetical protein
MSTPASQIVDDDHVEEIEIEFDSATENRRTASRTTLTLMGTVRTGSGKVINVRSVDVSSSGIGLLSVLKLEAGEECTAYIDLSVCGNEFQIEVTGRVVYCRALPLGGYRAGLQFIQMTTEARTVLESLLK